MSGLMVLIIPMIHHQLTTIMIAYGIVRSEGEKVTKSDEKASHYVLAQDSCKFGKLDI